VSATLCAGVPLDPDLSPRRPTTHFSVRAEAYSIMRLDITTSDPRNVVANAYVAAVLICAMAGCARGRRCLTARAYASRCRASARRPISRRIYSELTVARGRLWMAIAPVWWAYCKHGAAVFCCRLVPTGAAGTAGRAAAGKKAPQHVQPRFRPASNPVSHFETGLARALTVWLGRFCARFDAESEDYQEPSPAVLFLIKNIASQPTGPRAAVPPCGFR